MEREEAVSLRQRFVIHIHEDGTITDPRTTLMIKNIPNKYTQKMLLEEIDRNHFGAYDFFYLPIDFKVSNITFFSNTFRTNVTWAMLLLI